MAVPALSELALTQEQQARILAEARSAHPLECCGLLIGCYQEGGAVVQDVLPAPNVADAPERAFEIDPRVLFQGHRSAREQGRAILGWYHSHPAGVAVPSACDAERAVETGKVWIIVAGDEMAAYVADNNGHVAGRFRPLPVRVISPS